MRCPTITEWCTTISEEELDERSCGQDAFLYGLMKIQIKRAQRIITDQACEYNPIDGLPF